LKQIQILRSHFHIVWTSISQWFVLKRQLWHKNKNKTIIFLVSHWLVGLSCCFFLGFEANSYIEEPFPHDSDLYLTMVCSQETTLAKKNPAKTKPKTLNYTGDWDWFGLDCL
jgi:hypothetical protein